MFKLLFGVAIGAAAAWFLDPKHGIGRRDAVRDLALKHAHGGIGRPWTSREPAAERLNDPALQAKIESEAFRDSEVPKGKVSINVEDGIAWLRGEVADRATIERLRDATARIDGVRGVESLLHTPGQPAPTKDESHTTAGTSA